VLVRRASPWVMIGAPALTVAWSSGPRRRLARSAPLWPLQLGCLSTRSGGEQPLFEVRQTGGIVIGEGGLVRRLEDLSRFSR